MASSVATLSQAQIAALLPKGWRTRLYGTELVRVYILGDAIHRVWGPDV